MVYVFDELKKVDDQFNDSRSYLVSDGTIRYMNKEMNRWKGYRVSGKGFSIQAGHVMTMPKMTTPLNVYQFKQYQKELISKGCTTLIHFSKADYEKDLSYAIKRAKHECINSSLDYLVALEIPLRLLRPTVISTCKRLKVPLLKIHIDSIHDFTSVEWDQISQRMLTYPIVLIPIFKEMNEKKERQYLELWKWFCQKYRIQTEALPGNQVGWSKKALQKIGVAPLKGELLVSSDFDYQLFHQNQSVGCTIENEQGFSLEAQSKLDYDKREPNIVGLRNRLLKVENTVHLYPGYGRQIQFASPRRFLSIEEAPLIGHLHRDINLNAQLPSFL
ncbi:hypothetical protein [Bacillus sp. FJAT-45037]|uniref:hypothetical protein n=1 Tax=Bacillus sp. FJAT-45037 TaxID=2011007 RepID=UPI0012FDB752|nr:hypothetical protein [Bacillus sp. FJAT-45037]